MQFDIGINGDRKASAPKTASDYPFFHIRVVIRYDVMNNGLGTVDPNAFPTYNFVHCMTPYWPHTKRLEEPDTLVRNTRMISIIKRTR